MSLRFKRFRQCLIAFMILMYLVVIGLSLYLRPYLARADSVWILVSIPLSMIAGCIMSIFHVRLFGTPQTVVWELVWLTGFVPFTLIVVFVIYTGTSGTVPSIVVSVLFAAEILVFIVCSIHLLYALGLFVTAGLTAYAFDRQIWSRDLDSSPSPFPLGFLCRFCCPCLRRGDCTTNQTSEVEYAIRGLPIPTDCEVKDNLPGTDSPNLSSRSASRGTSSTSGLSSQDSQATEPKVSKHRPTGSTASLARSLIQVPDEFQRRTSIQV